MKKVIFTYLLVFFCLIAYSQQKKITANFTNVKPKIDGILNDSIWQNSTFESDFTQYEPYNGNSPSQFTDVNFAYDNYAIYIAAECKINNQGQLFSILSERDNFGQADYFGFYIDPYNTGITGYGFFVTSAGVQIDVKIDNNTENKDWDAVWYSKVEKSDSGFTVEMKIPYSAFRFPKKDKQNWRINFYRNIQQNREIVSWNYVDNSKTGIINQLGKIEGLNNIKPPLRMSFLPYISSYAQKYTNSPEVGRSYNGGLDFKYGINESFTIDMMVIPDFNQVETDEQKLNLSPYETYYDEKRYFFTEGTEIFNKGNIFYSRRIGKVPTKYNDVTNMLLDGEVIVSNPQSTQILNATKFSGKTKKGFGIGFLNAFTGTTYADILDTVNNNKKRILTEPFSNYNVLALNQPLPNNSYLSFTNTNFSSFGRNYTSFVTAEEAYLRNKNNSWAFFQRFSVSQIFDDTLDTDRGFAYRFALTKTSGKFRISASQTVYSDTYNPNDLGYLRQNNLMTNSLSFSYNIYKPFWQFLQWRNTLTFKQQSLYDSLRYIGTNVTFNSSFKFKNNTSAGLIIDFSIGEEFDYFEPRVDGKLYVRAPERGYTFWISTNYAEPFAYDIQGNFNYVSLNEDDKKGFAVRNSPRIRLSNNAFFVFTNNLQFDYNNYGYVGKSDTQDSVFFGKRNIKYTTNELQFEYIFSKNISSALKVRHYWSVIDYFSFSTLGDNGRLYPLNYSYRFIGDQDLNYNAFTVDFNFKWIFLPGSEFSFSYKQQILSSSNDLVFDYYDNFEKMYFNSSLLNSISFKLIFYVDYNSIRRKDFQ